ncbi:serine hydrolase [Clostridium sp. C8]|uniref:serine hydrolase n=1 Tax=Clostridium sp. C8 TaxID=1667357 RepID=UPI000A07CEB0|nr:serine hydrolase [Clostridium sp. C8]
MKKFLTKFLSGVLLVGIGFTSFGYSKINAYTNNKLLRNGSAMDAEMNKENLEKIDSIMSENISNNIIPGGVVLIAKDGEIVYNKAFGDAQKYDMAKLLDNPRKMNTETIFDLASVTKVMATTQGVMKLSYEGKLDVNNTVATYIPEFAKNGKQNVKVKDLLTHTSGLTPWKPTFFYANNPKEELDFICNLPLEYETGTNRKYSDFSFMTLAFVIEAITNQPLDVYLEENIYKVLDMNDTMFTPDESLKSRISATSWGNPYEYRMVEDDNFGYLCEENVEDFKGWRNYTLVGEVNDGNAFYANNGVAGHAGLFSTASDLAILGQAMLNGGEYNGVRLYDKKTLDEFTSIQSNFGHGYGWEINRGGENSGYMGKYATENVFGHTGFTGTQVIFDKENNLQIIILTNKQNLGVNSNGGYSSTFKLSRDIATTVYESILPKINISGVEDGREYNEPVRININQEDGTLISDITINGKPYSYEEISNPGQYILRIVYKSQFGKEEIKEIKFSIKEKKDPTTPIEDENNNANNGNQDKESNGSVVEDKNNSSGKENGLPNTGTLFGTTSMLIISSAIIFAGVVLKRKNS